MACYRRRGEQGHARYMPRNIGTGRLEHPPGNTGHVSGRTGPRSLKVNCTAETHGREQSPARGDYFVNTVARDRVHRSQFLDIAGIHLAADLDALDRHQIDQLRRHNLAAMLTSARQAPQVRRRFPELDAVSEVGDLAGLPVLSPADLAGGCPPHSAEYLLEPLAAGLALRSSGTASKPKVVYHSWSFNDRVRHLGVRGIRAALSGQPRRLANCLLAGEFGGAFLFVQNVAEALPVLAFPLGSRTSAEDAAEVIAEHEIDTLAATPAYGAQMATHTKARRCLPLRNFLYIGEPMGRERERMVRAAMPDLTVRSLAYSTSETGPVGYQCRHQQGNTHHVHEDAVVLEVVSNDGRLLPGGEAGELVVTPLTSSGMALFRYRLGDRGYLSDEPCGCGSAARSVVLLGRSEQSMTVDATTISTDQLMGGLAELGVTDPADCQFQVLWDGHEYQVRLLLTPATPGGITAGMVLGAWRGAHQLHRVVTSARCRAFSVERTAIDGFARTRQGKVPVLYQQLGRSDG